MSRVTTKNFFLASVMITGLALSGCSADEEEASPAPPQTTTDAETAAVDNESPGSDPSEDQSPVAPEGNDSEDVFSADVLAERDQFVEDQQLPMDGSHLTAITPEQKQFVAEQREHVESQGGAWNAQLETLTLALTADACETAILNSHDADTATVQAHISSSPLFLTAIPEGINDTERAQAEAGLADIMVYGMQHMCSEDFPQWRDAVTELYPEHFEAQQ